MKKLITSLLFFGSFGVVMAQTGPGGINDPYHTVWNPPVPNPNSCGTHKVRKTYQHESYLEHCESPGHQTLYKIVLDPNTNTWGPPIGVPYSYPNSNDRADFWSGYSSGGIYHPGWSKTHTDIKFVDPDKDSCNDFATEGACNSAMVMGKKKSLGFIGRGLTAALINSLWSDFFNSVGFKTPTKTRQLQGQNALQNQNISVPNGYETTNGCLWHGKRIDRIVEEKNQCFSDVCTIANTRMTTIQMEIYALEKRLSQIADDEIEKKLQDEIDRLRVTLSEVKLSCNTEACILSDSGIDAAGVSTGGYASCMAKPVCPCPSPIGGIPQNTSKCRPNPYCRRTQ